MGGTVVPTVMVATWHMLSDCMPSSICGANSRSRRESNVIVWQRAWWGECGGRTEHSNAPSIATLQENATVCHALAEEGVLTVAPRWCVDLNYLSSRNVLLLLTSNVGRESRPVSPKHPSLHHPLCPSALAFVPRRDASDLSLISWESLLRQPWPFTGAMVLPCWFWSIGSLFLALIIFIIPLEHS